MYPVFESIAVIDGVYQNLEAHNERVHRTAQALWQQKKPLNFLEMVLPIPPNDGVFKCRFSYNATHFDVQFSTYKPRIITTLHCYEAPDLFYEFKYSHRDAIDRYSVQLKSNEEVLFTRQGFLLDTSYANVALYREGKWYTPETPLLKGTRRAMGIRSGMLIPVPLHTNDLRYFETITWFNALLPIGEHCLPVNAIRY